VVFAAIELLTNCSHKCQSVSITTNVVSSNPAQARYNIMWYSLSVTCDRSMVFSGYSGFLHTKTWPEFPYFIWHGHFFLCVQRVKARGDCSLCWYWWNCWPLLFRLSFYNHLLQLNCWLVVATNSNQCLSPLTLWVRTPLRRGTILCDTVCQWLAAGRWFSLVTNITNNRNNQNNPD
jgi:hypothetical protein